MAKKPVDAKTAAIRLGLRIESLYHLLYVKRIAGEKKDGVWRIDPDSVDNYAAKRQR